MRLTKAMKKAFSLVLAGAMVITGANVNTTNASAEGNSTAVYEGALPWNAGGDGDCRIQLANSWAEFVLEETKDIAFTKAEVTFTIKGLANEVVNEPVGPAKGEKFTKGNFVYKVTKQAMTRDYGEVSVIGLSKAGKKAKSLTVADGGVPGTTYYITAIGKNAFKGAAATSVTLNHNIKSIPASAFANCKKLATLKLKAKLTSVKKGAFKGCTKKITVKGTAKKANVKTLKKSGYKKFK